jgi:hypothetical protein
LTEQVDMSQFIAARSDQMNADDLLDAPRTITVTKVSATPDSAEQPVSIHYEGDGGKPFKPCKTVRRIMVGIWGKDASQYVGRSMTLYRDPTVAFGGMQVGGIRVSHMSHMDGEKTVALMVTRGRKAPFKVLPLATTAQPVDDQAVALAAITEAAEQGTEALANVWKQKWLAPHRESLQLDLDRLKKVAAKHDPEIERATETPKSEPATTDAVDPLRSTLRQIEDAKSIEDIAKIDKETESDRAFLSEAQNERLDEALATRRTELRATEAAE